MADEHGFAAIGGQANQVSTVLKERYSDGMSLSEALSAALAALAAPNNGEQADVPSSQLEVAVLDRSRPHRTFRPARRRPPGGAAAGKPPGPIRRFRPG